MVGSGSGINSPHSKRLSASVNGDTIGSQMTSLRFRGSNGKDIAPQDWLRMWAGLYPRKYDPKHDILVKKNGSFSAADFERIGRWKDSAETEGKWKPNVASVAYQIWMQAARESPTCPDESRVVDFLQDWSERKYTDKYGSRTVQKRFGLSRATTLLYFISGGRFPIFDSRVRRALTRLLNSSVRNSVSWYVESYRPLFSEIAAQCGTEDAREVDKALFSFGDRSLEFPK
jgi:hypothetical protein